MPHLLLHEGKIEVIAVRPNRLFHYPWLRGRLNDLKNPRVTNVLNMSTLFKHTYISTVLKYLLHPFTSILREIVV